MFVTAVWFLFGCRKKMEDQQDAAEMQHRFCILIVGARVKCRLVWDGLVA